MKMTKKMTPKKRAWTSVPASPTVKQMVVQFATERGITQGEALDRIFKAIYPNAQVSLAPAAGDILDKPEVRGTSSLVAPPSPKLKDTMQEAAETLTSVHAVNLLSKGLDPNFDPQALPERPLSTRELMEYKILGLGGGGQGQDLPQQITQALTPVTTQLQNLQAEIGNLKVSNVAAERDALKGQLAEIQAQSARVQELAPLYEHLNSQREALAAMAERLEALSSRPASSATERERSEILELAESIKSGMESLAGKVGASQLGLDDLDNLLETVTKLQTTFNLKPGTEGGELDWKTITATNFGEISREIIREYGKIKRHEETESGGPTQSVEDEVIERRILHYATAMLEKGARNINVYEAAQQLGLTPLKVFQTLEGLEKKELITLGRKRGTQIPQTPPATRAPPGIQTPPTSSDFGGISEQQIRQLEASGRVVTG